MESGIHILKEPCIREINAVIVKMLKQTFKVKSVSAVVVRYLVESKSKHWQKSSEKIEILRNLPVSLNYLLV